VRVAVAGTHGTGKSTLIAAFLDRCPRYAHEAEAFETLGDDVDLTEAEGPTAEGLDVLLQFTVRAACAYASGADVIHERSPLDYVAYAFASRWPRGEARRFLAERRDALRLALDHLDLIALVPRSKDVEARAGEDERFRRRVDERLRRALIDDDHDLLGGAHAPRVAELSPAPTRWLEELLRLTGAAPP
jgi:hypothetical protein